MKQLGCYACDTGSAKHHQNGAQSWIECECGLQVGPKIDMSDTDHVGFALREWNKQAEAFVVAKQAADEGAVPPQPDQHTDPDNVEGSQEGQHQPPEGAEVAAHTPLHRPDGTLVDATGSLDAVDVHANTNTDMPREALDVGQLTNEDLAAMNAQETSHLPVDADASVEVSDPAFGEPQGFEGDDLDQDDFDDPGSPLDAQPDDNQDKAPQDLKE